MVCQDFGTLHTHACSLSASRPLRLWIAIGGFSLHDTMSRWRSCQSAPRDCPIHGAATRNHFGGQSSVFPVAEWRDGAMVGCRALTEPWHYRNHHSLGTRFLAPVEPHFFGESKMPRWFLSLSFIPPPPSETQLGSEALDSS